MHRRIRFVLTTLALPLLVLLGLAFWFSPKTEAAQSTTITVDTQDDALNSAGDCSLREAVIAANTDAAVDGCPAGSGADTIVLPAGFYTLTIAGAGENVAATGDLDITESLAINGAGALSTTIDGNALDRVFHVNPGQAAGVEVSISGVTIQNGSSAQGGGIYNDAAGSLTLTTSQVSGNRANEDGGGIYNFTSVSVLTLTNSTLFNNSIGGFSLDGGGGGLYNNGRVFITATTFLSNTSGVNQGGALWSNGALLIQNSNVLSNTAGGGGAVFVNFPGTFSISGSSLSHNRADSVNGGGISINGGNSATYSITNSTLMDNFSAAKGGGIASYGTNITISNTLVLSNTADGQGGGVWISTLETTRLTNSLISGNRSNAVIDSGGGGVWNEGNLFVTGSTITANEAAETGGGIYHVNGALDIRGSLISMNTAVNGGGGIQTGAFPGVVVESTVSKNVVAGLQAAGGGIKNSGGLSVRDSAIYSNTATGFMASGGGIFHDSSTLDLENTTLSGNSADGSGGGLAVAGGAASLNNVTVSLNHSDQMGGGLGDGGGVSRQSGIVTITNSIIAGNQDLSPGTVHPDCSSAPGGLASSGHNLVGVIDGCSWTAATGDLTGTLSAPLDPILGSLADNGGSTLTFALLTGSPAIDAGNPAMPGSGAAACEVVDQRGFSRLNRGIACDAGAFEVQQPPVYLPIILKQYP